MKAAGLWVLALAAPLFAEEAELRPHGHHHRHYLGRHYHRAHQPSDDAPPAVHLPPPGGKPSAKKVPSAQTDPLAQLAAGSSAAASIIHGVARDLAAAISRPVKVTAAPNQSPKDVVVHGSDSAVEKPSALRDNGVASPKIVPVVAAGVKAVARAAANGTAQQQRQTLAEELTELRQSKSNVAVVWKALKAERDLLRESALLERVSRGNSRTHKAALEQMRTSQAMVHQTENLAKVSESIAADQARDALKDADEVRKTADELISEASAQLRASGGTTIA